MKILFIHQNFPGQFKHLAPALVRAGHEVRALILREGAPFRWGGVDVTPYQVNRSNTAGLHPWLRDFESKVIRAEACMRACVALNAQGFMPDVVIAHPGWGESLFVKDVWPAVKLGIYCEYFYRVVDDVGFDPEFSRPADDEGARIRLKNVNNVLHFDVADAALSPTRWQADTFPTQFRRRITVVHDGIDSELLAPNPTASLSLRSRFSEPVDLTVKNEVITFVNRNLEPYRGWHVFARALPDLLKQRPRARVLIVGGDEVSYGAAPDPAQHGGLKTWREIMTTEVQPRIAKADWQRVHFLGRVPYEKFVRLLQVSTIHVYLTYPFVLSWSLLEAMSTGCAIVASDTAPVREVIQHDVTGRLVNFFDVQALVREVCELLDDPQTRRRLGAQARVHVQSHYELRAVCLPRQLAWVNALAGRPDSMSR